MKPLWVLGGGGHARVVIDAARSTGAFEVVGILDDSRQPGSDTMDGVPVRGAITRESLREFGIEHAAIAIGDNRVRAGIASRLDGLVSWESVIHAAAYVAPTANLEAGTVVFAGAVVQPGATIERHAVVNTGATVDHDSRIGAFVHIAPGANLAGAVTIGEGAFIGSGSVVIPGRAVGSWSTVGAGASVVRDIPANVTAVGVPAKVIKEREPGRQRD